MAKVPFTKLKLKVNNEVTHFTYGENDIQVSSFLPIEEKIAMIDNVIRKAESNNTYDELKLDMFFHLYLIFNYSNITFTQKQREDEYKLYDILSSSGFMKEFLSNFNEDEYNELQEMMQTNVKRLIEEANSAGSVIRNFIIDMPKNAEAANEIFQSFDPEKYQMVMDFATAANGGRPITELVSKTENTVQ